MKWFFGAFFIFQLLWAQEGILNKLLAPGPLVKGHASLEKKDCLKCHDAGKGIPDSKCLDCHKEIKIFIDRKVGFHGLNTLSCRECHTEHKGRMNDTVFVDSKNFSHGEKTGYSLDGKHADLKCTDCHKQKMPNWSVRAGDTRFFGAQSTCISCHKKDDVHFFKDKFAKKDCISCHSLKSWKEDLKFDHKRDTGYDLQGKHAKLTCVECHTPKNQQGKILKVVYKWPQLKSKQCLTCHSDQHKNNLSQKFQNGNCQTCHSQTEWKITSFDHSVTHYPLRGKHSEISCQECHTQKTNPILKTQDPKFKFTGLKSDCLSCHKDYHLFKGLKLKNFGNLNNCQSCHNEKNWKEASKFNHNLHTRYKIDGEHSKLNCTECHIQRSPAKSILKVQYKWEHLNSKTCENCHKSPHLNQFSPALLKKACTECHVTTGWYDMKNGKKFDHSKTRFNLTGAHQQITCQSCHGPQGKQNFKFKSAELKFCIDCHKDIHKNQFSTKLNTNNCTTCHTTENFTKRLDFNHNETRYPLEGAHSQLNCIECHKPTQQQVQLIPPNIKQSETQKFKNIQLSQFLFPNVKKGECLQCHSDYHQKQLGQNCLDCHNLESWKKIRFNHNKQSEFVLKFKHEELKCAECHKPRQGQTVQLKDQLRKVTHYKPINSACLTCHKDHHRGEFGAKCQECHTEKGWRVTKDFHKNFSLTGVHFSLECAECHKENRKLSGTSQMCITCHAKDDVHNGTLPQCQDCHRQQFWEVTGFKHSLTQFPLRGVHRTLDCMECHRSGSYKGLISTCASCHLSEALAVTVPNHSGFSNLNSCQECHLNQFAW